MNAILQRRPATPYARRLARERGIDLLAITGTGPNGRIVAADIEAFVPRQPVSPTTAPAATMPAAAVFATTIDLAAAKALVASLAGAGMVIGFDDMFVRAAAQALEHSPFVGADAKIVVALEQGGKERRSLRIESPQTGLMTALHARIQALRDAADTGASGTAHLSIRHLEVAGVRAVSMPLSDGAPLRLVVSTGNGAAEALLAFDATGVDEESAARLLAAFRDALETPLRLLA